MFQAKIKADTLKQAMNVVSTLVDEAKLKINKDGLGIKAVDPAHVALVEMTLRKDAFEEYNADEQEVGIDLERLTQAMELGSGDDIISLKLDEEKSKLILNVENLTRKMPLIDTTGMTDPKVPSLNLPVKVIIETIKLDKGVKASKNVSDHVAIIVNPEGFKLKSEGDSDSVDLEEPKTNLIELVCKEQIKSLFSLDYFQKMIKSASKSDNITLLMGNDYPVKMEFEIANGNGKVIYLLAPRIEGD